MFRDEELEDLYLTQSRRLFYIEKELDTFFGNVELDKLLREKLKQVMDTAREGTMEYLDWRDNKNKPDVVLCNKEE